VVPGLLLPDRFSEEIPQVIIGRSGAQAGPQIVFDDAEQAGAKIPSAVNRRRLQCPQNGSLTGR